MRIPSQLIVTSILCVVLGLLVRVRIGLHNAGVARLDPWAKLANAQATRVFVVPVVGGKPGMQH